MNNNKSIPALCFTLQTKITHRIDLSVLSPDTLSGMPINKIAKLKIAVGHQKISVEKLFTIEGEDTQNLIFKKASNKLDGIGRGMSHGSITVRGSVGDRLGQEMSGGLLTVHGHADDWVGTGMTNGHIDIRKNVRDFLGGALPGQARGQSGGTIHVAGDCGDRAGDRMRRGMMVIEGNTGDYTGSRMIAGTIMVCGQAGHNTGFAMKRGSIIMRQAPASIPATFNDCGLLELNFLQLIFKSLAQSNKRLKDLAQTSSWATRYAGDLGNQGLGELIILS